MRRYTVVLVPDPDGRAWNVSVPALPGCFTWGETVEEALGRARNAIAGWIADPEEDLGAIPDAVVATVTVPEPARTAGAIPAATAAR